MANPPRTVDDHPDRTPLPHVVIVGGGFAGIAAARGLADQPVGVTIVDRHNFHTFQPLLYQVATAGLEPADIAYPIRTIFGHEKNIRFRHGSVRAVDQVRKVVILLDESEIAFDYLIIATGTVASFFAVPGAQEFALPLYTLADARRLRNRLLLSLEAAEVEVLQQRPRLNFVVVGGGPTGVETSGALSELIRIAIKRDGLSLRTDEVRIILVDIAPRLLTAFPERASTYAKKELESMNVEVALQRGVVEVLERSIKFDNGEELDTAAVIWAAGVTVNGTVAQGLSSTSGPSGRASVDADLRLHGSSNVWVVGDAAAVPSGQGDICAQLAPVAIQSGRHCAAQVLKVIGGQPTTEFRYHNKGIMATIGRNAAVAKLPRGGVITGIFGWMAWLGLHLWYLVGFRNRLRVMINWMWRYFDWPSGPRLIVADVETVE
jgi:NADH dehydrogenase